jgi:hypothetical protein
LNLPDIRGLDLLYGGITSLRHYFMILSNQYSGCHPSNELSTAGRVIYETLGE